MALLTRQGFEGQGVQGHIWNEGRLRIMADPGGEVFHRMAYAQWLEAKGTSIEVHELCASACTFHLRNPNLCASPASLWMFHRSFLLSGPPPWYAKVFVSAADAFHARIYPDGVPEWIRGVEAQMGPDDELWIAGQDLIDKGWLAACDGDERSVDAARFLAMSETHRYANIASITRETLLDTRLVAPDIYVFKHSVKTRLVAQEGQMKGSRPGADPSVQQGFIDEANLKNLVGGRAWSKLEDVFAVTAEGREILRTRGQVMDDKDPDRKRLREASSLPVYDAFADGHLTDADLYRVDKDTQEAFSVRDGKVMPQAIHFDYIFARLSNATYDLERAAEHLRAREDIWMFPCKSEWGGEPVYTRRAAPGDKVILDIPGYNEEPGREHYLAFTWAPSQEAYEAIISAERVSGIRADKFKTIFDLDLLGLRACGAALCDAFYKDAPAPESDDPEDPCY